jgi:hypothetical protein
MSYMRVRFFSFIEECVMNTRSFDTDRPGTPDDTAIVQVAVCMTRDRIATAASAWLIVLALLAAAAPVHSQNIPVIGGYTWVYDGSAPDTNYLYRNARFRSMTHLPSQGVLVAGVHTARWPSTSQLGALFTIDEHTGAVLRLDSICPRVGNQSIRSAWLNDGGTVMCYTCMDERPRLVEYPLMREIEDTVLLKKDSLGDWFWAEAHVSSTGRYLILYQYGGSSLGGYHWLWLYDRLTGELTKLDRSSVVYDNDGEDPDYRPQFSGDDRLLVTRDRTTRGLTVWDVAQRREIGSLAPSNTRYLYMLSHTGDKLLVSTVRPTLADQTTFAAVYDAWTMTPEWYIPVENFPGPFAWDHYGALSHDGTEVILTQAIQTDTGVRIGFYWYALPDTAPRGFMSILSDFEWLQPKTKSTGIVGGMIGHRPVRYSWNPAMSVTTPPESPKLPLYPNPTTGEVSMDVGQCISESWHLRLSNHAGSLIFERNEACQNGVVRTSLPSLPAGQYYLQLREPLSGRSVQATVIIQR